MERLASDSADERRRAERWLATNLETGDYPELARAAQRGDAEVRRRLRAALAAEDRHLGLACLLLSEPHAELVAVGAAAFEELVLRWCPGADEAPADRAAVLRVLARHETTRYALEASVEPPAHTLERLDRLGDLALPLVVAPELRERADQTQAATEGTGARLLAELAPTLVGVGDFSEEDPGPSAWMAVSTLGAATGGDAITWLRVWCRRVQAATEPDAQAAAAARALAATAWPAALAWLEERWLERRDENALSGLMYAAERGRVAPGLTRPGERRRILAWADRGLADPLATLRSERAARALAAMGAASPSGEDPALELIEGFEELSPAARWVRLVALEGVRSEDPRGIRLLTEQGRRPGSAPPGLRTQALRALAVLPPGPASDRQPDGVAELLEFALRVGRGPELAGLLVELGGDPMAALEAEGLTAEPAGSPAARFALEVAYGAGRPEAGELLARALAAGAPARGALAEEVRAWVRRDGPEPAAALLARAAEGLGPGPRGELERFALRCGCLAPARQVAVYAELAERASLAGDDYELLGALAAGPRGQGARDLLLRELAGTGARSGAALVAGLDRATEELRRALEDEAYERFVQAVLETAAVTGHPLRARLRGDRWPPPVLPPARPLDLPDRRLPPGL
jgi:hypothetical protein